MKTTFLKTAAIGALLGGGTFALSACSADTVPAQPKAKPPIASAAELGRRIEILSDDAFEGRAPGTQGGIAASQYIADEMAAAGLVPMGDDGTYFQTVELTAATVLPSSTMSISVNGQTVMDADQKTNGVYWSKRMGETLTVDSSDIVFVGYGVVAPEYDWNDYAGVDVRGKTVVMLVNDPGFATKDEALFKGGAMTYYGRWTYKFEEAGRQGAAAAIIIHDTEPASYGWDVVSGSWTGAQYDLVRPDGGASRTTLEGWIHMDTAQALFDASGVNLAAMMNAAAAPGFSAVPMTGATLSATINQDVKVTQSRNVAGGVIGTETPDEYVLYMAHWDHLGKDATLDGDHIYNGAVDNATGTAAILEIGEAFVQQGAPKRSALFVAVTAEESGLLGSAYYAEKPLVPLNKTVAGVNIDALHPIGKTKDMIVVGYGASELEDRLKAVLDPRSMYIVPDPSPGAGYFYRSDHISLAKKGVPMLYAGTGNEHLVMGLEYGEGLKAEYNKLRYHKPGDEYDNSWDLSGIEQTTEILFELGYGIANDGVWPSWYEGSEFKALRDAMMDK